jgi:hypothetical protein
MKILFLEAAQEAGQQESSTRGEAAGEVTLSFLEASQQAGSRWGAGGLRRL